MAGIHAPTGPGLGDVDPEWSLAAAEDLGGDGRSDNLWRQASTGMVSLWRFTSPSTIEGLDIGPVGAEWTVLNP